MLPSAAVSEMGSSPRPVQSPLNMSSRTFSPQTPNELRDVWASCHGQQCLSSGQEVGVSVLDPSDKADELG